MTPRKITIDEALFADDQAAEYNGFDPAENRHHREQIDTNPEQHLLIESTSHGNHHLMLLAFLDSKWTRDESLRTLVKECYLSWIGGWKTNVRNNPLIHIDPEEIITKWHQFVDVEMRKIMEQFLVDNEVEYEWCG